MLAIWGATIMAGPMLGPLLGGVITDVASWRWIFALNVPLGAVALVGLSSVPSSTEPVTGDRVDHWGIVMLVIATGSLQLALQRSIGQIWPPAPETLGAAAAAVCAGALIALRASRGRFALFRFDVFRDTDFTIAALYTFLVGAILFTTIVFIPALAEGPFAWSATDAGLAISPRGIGTMAMMLAMRYVIDHLDYRALLTIGLLITAGALELMAQVPSHGGGVWLAATGAAQGIGIGLVFTPLSTIAFSSLAAELRTDAAGLYNLARQLGCATGVAAMTAVLQARIHSHLKSFHPAEGIVSSSQQAHSLASFAAYTDCFRLLAIITLMMVPGVLLFRMVRPSTAALDANSGAGAP